MRLSENTDAKAREALQRSFWVDSYADILYFYWKHVSLVIGFLVYTLPHFIFQKPLMNVHFLLNYHYYFLLFRSLVFFQSLFVCYCLQTCLTWRITSLRRSELNHALQMLVKCSSSVDGERFVPCVVTNCAKLLIAGNRKHWLRHLFSGMCKGAWVLQGRPVAEMKSYSHTGSLPTYHFL